MGVFWPPAQAAVTSLLWFFGSSTVIPGIVDAPLIPNTKDVFVGSHTDAPNLQKALHEAEKEREREGETIEIRDTPIKGGKMPLVVFTHGMAGMSQSYSHYLGSIASHGYVVAAVEHRDGSGPGTIVHRANGSESFFWHVVLNDLQYVQSPHQTTHH